MPGVRNNLRHRLYCEYILNEASPFYLFKGGLVPLEEYNDVQAPDPFLTSL